MRKWMRLESWRLCGQCGVHLGFGDPVLTIQLPGLHRHLIRCQTCVGPAPPDLPLLPVKSHMTKRMTPLRSVIPMAREKMTWRFK